MVLFTNSYCSHRIAIHLRALLRQRSHFENAVRVVAKKRLRGWKSDRQMEEARVREGTWRLYESSAQNAADRGERVAMLLAMYTDQGDEFQRNLHLSGPKGDPQGGSDDRMCCLWVQRMFFERLIVALG